MNSESSGRRGKAGLGKPTSVGKRLMATSNMMASKEREESLGSDDASKKNVSSEQDCQQLVTAAEDRDGREMKELSNLLKESLKVGKEPATSQKSEGCRMNGAVARSSTTLVGQIKSIQASSRDEDNTRAIASKDRSSTTQSTPQQCSGVRGERREITFDPPWAHRIGHLQCVVETLRRHSRAYLQAKSSVIVRCYPLGGENGRTYAGTVRGSCCEPTYDEEEDGELAGGGQPWVYMKVVYDLLYSIGSVNHYQQHQQPWYQSSNHAPQQPQQQQLKLLEVQPILLDYSNSNDGALVEGTNRRGGGGGVSTIIGTRAIGQYPAKLDGGGGMESGVPLPNRTSEMCRQIPWTACCLLRCRFPNEAQASQFLRAFNHSVRAVFNMRAVRVPFAHPDHTWPERQLRQRLHSMCKEWNNDPSSGGQSAAMMQQRCARGGLAMGRYFHDGIRVFKVLGQPAPRAFSFGNTEPVRLEELSPEVRHFHSVVCTLRKFAQAYEEKRFNAIIRNLPQHPSRDQESLAKVIDSVLGHARYAEQMGYCSHHGGGSQDSLATQSTQKSRSAWWRPPLYRAQRLERRQHVGGNLFLNHENASSFSTVAVPPALVRVQFGSTKEAATFIRLFSSLAQEGVSLGDGGGGGYEGSYPRKLFAHPDLTSPELALSYALKSYCRERNDASNNKEWGSGVGVTAMRGKPRRFYVHHSRVFERVDV